MARVRLDQLLTERGLAQSRADAQARIHAGDVILEGAPNRNLKPGLMVDAAAGLSLVERPRWASRAGAKLEAALVTFAIDVAGGAALDAGASTGGFTDVLLARGARVVYAVDVGYGQLHERLRGDARVTVAERTNIRDLRLPEPVDVVVADLSFISLRTVAPALVGANARPAADIVVLIKPQFEAGRAEAGKGRGVIRDPGVWRRVLEEVRSALEREGAAMMEVMASPLKGAEGNVEFLAHARAHDPSPSPADGPCLDAAIADAPRGP